MAIFSLRGCVILLGSTWDKRGSFGVHMYQKDPKSAKKWLSYGHFLTERLHDSIEKHMGQNGILWCLFVPKISKISQEIAELGQLPPERLCDSIEKHMGQRGFLWCSFSPKRKLNKCLRLIAALTSPSP